MSRRGQVSPHGRWGHSRSYRRDQESRRRDQVSRRRGAVTASLLSLLSLLSPRVASSRAILPEFLCRHRRWASHIRLVVTGPKQEEEETIASASQRPLPGFPPHPTHPPFPITIVIGGCTTNRSPPSFTARRMVLLLLYPAVRHSAGREAGGGAVELLGGRPRTGTGVTRGPATAVSRHGLVPSHGTPPAPPPFSPPMRRRHGLGLSSLRLLAARWRPRRWKMASSGYLSYNGGG
jgi:hypothetical protein